MIMYLLDNSTGKVVEAPYGYNIDLTPLLQDPGKRHPVMLTASECEPPEFKLPHAVIPYTTEED